MSGGAFCFVDREAEGAHVATPHEHQVVFWCRSVNKTFQNKSGDRQTRSARGAERWCWLLVAGCWLRWIFFWATYYSHDERNIICCQRNKTNCNCIQIQVLHNLQSSSCTVPAKWAGTRRRRVLCVVRGDPSSLALMHMVTCWQRASQSERPWGAAWELCLCSVTAATLLTLTKNIFFSPCFPLFLFSAHITGLSSKTLEWHQVKKKKSDPAGQTESRHSETGLFSFWLILTMEGRFTVLHSWIGNL